MGSGPLNRVHSKFCGLKSDFFMAAADLRNDQKMAAFEIRQQVREINNRAIGYTDMLTRRVGSTRQGGGSGRVDGSGTARGLGNGGADCKSQLRLDPPHRNKGTKEERLTNF
jgi:hypothetical protein